MYTFVNIKKDNIFPCPETICLERAHKREGQPTYPLTGSFSETESGTRLSLMRRT